MDIPEEVYLEAQVRGVLGQATKQELFDELRARGVSPEEYKGYDYAMGEIESHRSSGGRQDDN